ncbi:hypothetical protein J4717_19575, partial [Phaeobacter sp. HS012]|jgi:hypothetical protein|uniref:hypothetical protein n=1 Tax=unclassified Phaeobacter TaxID=2621772 RepID=UPI001B36E3A0
MKKIVIYSLASLIPALAGAEEYDWRYVPFFEHQEVQECARNRASEWAAEGKYSEGEILSAAEKFNSFLPELTKTSDRDMAHIQLRAMAQMWQGAKANLRPGFSLNLHEYANGLVVTCTFDVFDRHYKNGD